jgi:glycerophosphoryl diester phosphodiesterase
MPIKTQIIAHRGASHDAPENTLSAFHLAWDQNADGIEGDFHLTKDNKIVCLHDDTTERTGNVTLDAASVAASELRRLDVGCWKGPGWAGEQIPMLSEVLGTVPRDKRIYIELKSGPEIVPFLEKDLIKSRLLPQQVMIIAFDAQVLAAVKQSLPMLKAFWLTNFTRNNPSGLWAPSADTILETLIHCRADGVDLKAHTMVDHGFVQLLHTNKKEVHAWDINDPETARRFQEMGADSLTTNYPGQIRKALETRIATKAA